MNNSYVENLTCVLSEFAKRSNLSFSLSGWPAAAALTIISLSAIAKYARNN